MCKHTTPLLSNPYWGSLEQQNQDDPSLGNPLQPTNSRNDLRKARVVEYPTSNHRRTLHHYIQSVASQPKHSPSSPNPNRRRKLLLSLLFVVVQVSEVFFKF
jgi:hypothetical protein